MNVSQVSDVVHEQSLNFWFNFCFKFVSWEKYQLKHLLTSMLQKCNIVVTCMYISYKISVECYLEKLKMFEKNPF